MSNRAEDARGAAAIIDQAGIILRGTEESVPADYVADLFGRADPEDSSPTTPVTSPPSPRRAMPPSPRAPPASRRSGSSTPSRHRRPRSSPR